MCFFISHKILYGTAGGEEDSLMTCTTITRIKDQCFQSNMESLVNLISTIHICIFVYKYSVAMCIINIRVRWCTCSLWRML